MAYEINADKYAFAQASQPEKVDENYNTALVKRMVSAETKKREETDAILEQSILNEVYARTDGDIELKGQIDNETLARNAQTSSLEARLRAETDARILKDDELSARLSEETRQRAAADTSLLQAVDNLEADISNESARRAALYNELSNKIELKANAADVYTKSYIDLSLTGLKKDVEDEQNARYQADNDLQEQINLKANINDVYTKSYLDSAFSNKYDKSTGQEVEESVFSLEQTKENKTVILTNSDKSAFTFKVNQMHNGEYRCAIPLVSLALEFDNGIYPEDYISALSFDCGEGLTEVSYPATSIINWVGTDCVTSGGYSVFQPSSGTHYDIVFYFNGAQFIALVNGFVPATGNEGL